MLDRVRRAREVVRREFDEMEMDLCAVLNEAHRAEWDAEMPAESMLSES
jgi:hypothetical protein